MTNSPGTRPSWRVKWKGLVVLPLLAGAALVGANTASAVPDPPAGLEATPPDRFFDSRGEAKVEANSFITIQIAGVGDVPDDAEAVVVNVAAVEAEAPGFVSVLPASSSTAEPGTSNLNIDAAGLTIANTAIIPLGDGGAIDVFTSITSHILVDVLGYIPAGADYSVIDLERALDTRPAGATADTGYDVDVIGDFGPSAGADLVIVNLTLVNSEAGGFLTAYPKGASFPPTSNLNVEAAGQTRAGLAIVPIGDDGSITVYTSVAGELLVDVLGYFGGESGFNGLDPFDRILDTRPGRVPALSTNQVQVTASDDVPATASFVLVNVTAVEASEAGFITVWPNGLDQPNASNLNYSAGGTIANTVLVPVGDGGVISIFTQSEIALLVDIIGWI